MFAGVAVAPLNYLAAMMHEHASQGFPIRHQVFTACFLFSRVLVPVPNSGYLRGW